MNGEQAPVAPTEQQLASEAPNIKNEDTTAQAPAAPATPTADIPADQIETFNKFISANGGFDKAFSKLKNDVSNPQPAKQPEVQRPVQAQEQPVQQAQQIPQGYITQEEFAVQQYFNSLAREDQYAPIADKINSGEVFTEMAKFGIKPAQNGMFNDGQVREFLGLLAKTVPAQAPAQPITNTPTVDYYEVGDKITNQEQALNVIRQNITLKAKGLAEHPRTKEAKEFLSNSFSK